MLNTVFDEILASDTFEEWRQKLNSAIQGLEDVSVVANEIEKISLMFSHDESLSSGLNVQIREGVIRDGSQTYDIPATLVAVGSGNGIHIIYIDVNLAQTVTAPLSGTPSLGIIPLFRVTVAAGVITEIKDIRTWANVFVDTSLILSAKQEEVFDVTDPFQWIFDTTIDDLYINNVSVYINGLRLAQGPGEAFDVSSTVFNKIRVTLSAPATAGQQVLVVANQDDHAGNVKLVQEVITATSNGQTIFTVTDPELLPTAPNLAIYVQGVRQHSFTLPSPNEIELTSGVDIGTEVLVVKNETGGSDNLAILEEGEDGQILYKVVSGFSNTVEWRDPEFDASVIISGTINHNRIPKATAIEAFEGVRNDVFVTPATIRGASLRAAIDHWHERKFASNNDFIMVSSKHPEDGTHEFYAATRYGTVISYPENLTSWNNPDKHVKKPPFSSINAIAATPLGLNFGERFIIVASDYGIAYLGDGATNKPRPGQGVTTEEWIIKASPFSGVQILDVVCTDKGRVYIVWYDGTNYGCSTSTFSDPWSGSWSTVIAATPNPIHLYAPAMDDDDTNDNIVVIGTGNQVTIINDSDNNNVPNTVTDTALAISGSDFITAVIAIWGTASSYITLVGTNQGRIFKRTGANISLAATSAYTEVTYPATIPASLLGAIRKFLPADNPTADQLFVISDNFVMSASNATFTAFDSETNLIGGKLVSGSEFHTATCGANLEYSTQKVSESRRLYAQNDSADLLIATPNSAIGDNSTTARFAQSHIKAFTNKNSPAPSFGVLAMGSAGGLTAVGAGFPVNAVWALQGNVQGGIPLPVQGDLLAVDVIRSIYEQNGDDRFIIALANDGVYVASQSPSTTSFTKTTRAIASTLMVPKMVKKKDSNYYITVVNKSDSFVIYGAIDYVTPPSVAAIGEHQIELSSIVGAFTTSPALSWGGGTGTFKNYITGTRIAITATSTSINNLSIGETITQGGNTAVVVSKTYFAPIDGCHHNGNYNFYISPIASGSPTNGVCYTNIANIATDKGTVYYLPEGGVGELPVPSGFKYTSICSISGETTDILLVGTDTGRIYACPGNPVTTPNWSILPVSINGIVESNLGGEVLEMTVSGNKQIIIAKISNGKYYASPNGSDWVEMYMPTENGITRIVADDKSSFMFGEAINTNNQLPSYYKMSI